MPLHLIPESYYKNIQFPKYRYVVDADNNQKLIEEELEKKISYSFGFSLYVLAERRQVPKMYCNKR